MSEERYYPLYKVAQRFSVTPKTVRAWAERELGLKFPRHKFRRTMLSETHVNMLIKNHVGVPDWSRKSKAVA